MPVILDARVVAGSGGGPDKTIINSPRYLEADGYRMLCVYLHHPEDAGFEMLRRKATAKSVELISVADRGPFDWRVVPQLLEICRREKVDIWHGHDYKSNVLGLLLRRFWPMRLVTTLHGWVHQTGRTPLYYLMDRLTLRFYEKVICVSEDLHRASRSAGVPAHRCVLLENGIDLIDFHRRLSTSEAKREWGFNPDRRLIGAAGRLSSEKGFDLLIQAVDRLISAGLEVELAIAGEGVEKESLQQLIRELGREDRIQLLGYRANLLPFYEAMDVYALSSHREGLPNVLLEALAMKVPVVATRVNGVPKLITEGVDGLLVEPGSAKTLEAGLRTMLGNVAIRQRFAEAGRRTVETRYSFALRMQKLRQIYDAMLIE